MCEGSLGATTRLLPYVSMFLITLRCTTLQNIHLLNATLPFVCLPPGLCVVARLSLLLPAFDFGREKG